MKKLLFVLISLFLINSVYSFTQITTPTNNSILTQLNQTITTTISGTENTSTFINWDNSLLGYWNFDSGNSTHIFDLSSNSNNGTYTNGVTNNNSNSIRGSYSNFDGSNDYINLGSEAHLDNLISDYTICSWIKPNSFGEGSWGRIFSKRSGGASGIELYVSNESGNEKLILGHTGTASSADTNSFTIKLNIWQFICGVHYDSLDIGKLYHSGIDVTNTSSISDIVPHSLANAHIGKRSMDSLRQFNGSIDEVMIFNRTLSDTEIKSLYNSQINNFEFNVTNLNNLTNYNYDIFTTNTTGHLLKQSYNFYTNTSYTPQIIQTQSTTNLPASGMIPILLIIISTIGFLLF